MMGFQKTAMANRLVACLCALFASTSQAEEATSGFYLGAGWPGGGYLQRLTTSDGQGSSADPLMIQAQEMGTTLARNHRTGGSFSSGALHLRAGYDFGAVQGYVTISGEADQSQLLREGDIGVGVALPLNPNMQLLGELQQHQPDNHDNSSHVWSVTAAFRF